MSVRRHRIVALLAAAMVVVAACSPTSAAPGSPEVSPTTAERSAFTTSPPSVSPDLPVASSSDGAAPSGRPVGTDDAAADDAGSADGGAASAEPGTSLPPAALGLRLPGEPDPVLTPGALNPDVTQATIGSTICIAGWTATVRPSTSFTNGLKVQQIATYGYTTTSLSAYEEDHLIPLQLGGAPADPRNLWPEPYSISLADGRAAGARIKDAFETSLKRQVCSGALTLAAAQARIGIHWVHAYYGIPVEPAPASSPTATPGTSPASPTPRPTTTAAAGSTFGVTFVALPDPAVPGSKATMTVTTKPGAVCAAKVTWPSGTVSAAAGLKATPTADAAGTASWTWNVGSTTKGGTATARVTCTSGTSVTASHTFPVA